MLLLSNGSDSFWHTQQKYFSTMSSARKPMAFNRGRKAYSSVARNKNTDYKTKVRICFKNTLPLQHDQCREP